MKTFQFYQKDKVILHLDIDSSSFSAEKDQIVDQGFERIGDIVKAENSQSANDKFKTIYFDELQEFSNTCLFSSVVGALAQN